MKKFLSDKTSLISVVRAVGVGSQALPTPTDEYEEKSGELGGLLDGGRNEDKT